MTAFRVLLVVLFAGISGYTAVVAANHGFGQLEIFFDDIATMGWPGQFNVDFSLRPQATRPKVPRAMAE